MAGTELETIPCAGDLPVTHTTGNAPCSFPEVMSTCGPSPCHDAPALPAQVDFGKSEELYPPSCCKPSVGRTHRDNYGDGGETRRDKAGEHQTQRDNYGDGGETRKDKAGVVHDVTISHNGRSDVVSAIVPEKGQSLSAVLKKLHPQLSEKQLADEVKAVARYNKAYGNDIGDGTTIGDKPVYLTSIKYKNDAGQVTRVESPTGAVTEFEYKGKDVVGLKVTDAQGHHVEELKKDSTGWKSHDGKHVAKAVHVDASGNATIEQSDGTKTAYLTRGDKVTTTMKDGKPEHSITTRDGAETVSYRFEKSATNELTAFATFPGNNQETKLDEKETKSWLDRLRAADIYEEVQKPVGINAVAINARHRKT